MSGIRLTEVDDATIATPPTGKATIFLDDTVGPAYKDDTGTVHELEGDPGADAPPLTYQDHGNTGSTETVDASAADVHRLVANAATVTLTLTGAPAAGTPAVIRLWLEQDGTGGRDWVFPGSVDFGDPGEPDWTTRAGGAIDIVDLMTVDGGTVWEATLAGREGPAGADGADGADGIDGTVGGAIAIPYTFSTTTTDSDPGSGNLRLSNATQNAAATIRADLLDALGATVTGVLDSFADTDNPILGDIRLFKTDDPSKWLTFEVSAVATPSGYRNISVSNTGSSASSPFSNGDGITLAFTRSGDTGATGGGGTPVIRLDYALASDITNQSVTGGTPYDMFANQNFTVGNGSSLIEIVVNGYCFITDASGGNQAMGVVVIDSGGTPVTKYFGGENETNGSAATRQNPLGGAVIWLSGLAAGTHTIKIQYLNFGAGTWHLYCRASTNGPPSNGAEHLYVQVIEHP